MTVPVVLLGGGGHAGVALEALRALDAEVLGFAGPDDAASDLDLPWLGADEEVLERDPATVRLVNGVGFVPPDRRRREVYRRFREEGYRFPPLVHPDARVADDVRLASGVQVMRGATVQPGSRVGENVIVNSGAVVDHDCRLDEHCHLATGGVLAGGVRLENGSFVGAGATVVPGTVVGTDAVVGAGAVVLESVPAGATVVGVPARSLDG